MRAMVDAKAFSEALNHVSKVIRKSSIPVLEGVLIRFENGRCTLTGTDFTTWLTVSLPSQGDDFSFVLHKPSAAVKACQYFNDELAIETHETRSESPKAVFSCGRRSGEFDILPAKAYPERPEQKEGVSFTADAAVLLKRIDRVKYAVRKPAGSSYRADQTYVQFSGNDVSCVDGWRAACDTAPALRFPKPFLTWGDSLSFLKLKERFVKTIKSFQITGTTISGFKCYQEPTELAFGNLTVITGGNGQGKTSVADAIAFAVMGLPFFGERGLDRLHNEANPECP